MAEISSKRATVEARLCVTINKHVAYFLRTLHMLPEPFSSLDTTRLSVVYFCVSALDLLGALERVDHSRVIEWVYSLQVVPTGDRVSHCGFRGGNFLGHRTSKYDVAHVAMTYTALAVLLILGDDLSRVDKSSVIKALKTLQQDDGRWSATTDDCECDMRFVFCAAAISFFLDDWSGFDKERTAQFINSCRTYDSGIGLNPGLESHGGSCYCAVSALKLMGCYDKLDQKNELRQWCLNRQVNGFQGRMNKDPDVCYSFWVGGSLQMLDALHLVDAESATDFILKCQSPSGGFSKFPDMYSDVLHSYYSVSSEAAIRLETEIHSEMNAR